jgi:hypothetical protein
MRRVIVSKFVWSEVQKRNLLTVAGEASFHQFGLDYEEFDGGPGNYSCAIIEWDDGQVETVPASQIRFIKTETDKQVKA